MHLPDFNAFLSRLVEAVKHRDADFVVSIASPEIKTDFGDVLAYFIAGD